MVAGNSSFAISIVCTQRLPSCNGLVFLVHMYKAMQWTLRVMTSRGKTVRGIEDNLLAYTMKTNIWGVGVNDW